MNLLKTLTSSPSRGRPPDPTGGAFCNHVLFAYALPFLSNSATSASVHDDIVNDLSIPPTQFSPSSKERKKKTEERVSVFQNELVKTNYRIILDLLRSPPVVLTCIGERLLGVTSYSYYRRTYDT
jgi:hypothetical protein